MTAAATPAATRPRSTFRRPRHLRQRSIFCDCGHGTPSIAGLCRSCYRARAHSRSRFAGNRELVLDRDRTCRGCGVGKTAHLHVHHRRPGVHDPTWLITLCAACHARVHRLSAIRPWLPESLVEFWIEQHPGTPVQLQLSLTFTENADGDISSNGSPDLIQS